MRETRVRSLGWGDPLEKEMATHSSILAWRIPWTEEPGRLQSMGSQRVGHDWVTLLTYLLTYGFSVSALWCPLATPTILLGFLLPWARKGKTLCSGWTSLQTRRSAKESGHSLEFNGPLQMREHSLLVIRRRRGLWTDSAVHHGLKKGVPEQWSTTCQDYSLCPSSCFWLYCVRSGIQSLFMESNMIEETNTGLGCINLSN